VIRWVLRRVIDKVERQWNYDASHICDMIDASPRATWMVSRVTDLLAAAALVGGFGLAAPAAARWPHAIEKVDRSSSEICIHISDS